MLRNIGSNWALALIQLVVLIQLTPVQVEALGPAAQGAWLTITSLTSILGLLILGVPMASVRFITAHVAKNETDKANEAIATCLGVALGLGATATVVGVGLYTVFERVYLSSAAWKMLGPEVLQQARSAYWLVVLQVGLGFAGQLPFGILDAHHDFLARNGVKLAGLAARVVMIAVVLRHWPSLVILGVAQLFLTVLEFAIALMLIRRRWPGIRFNLRGFDGERLRQILGFSLFVMLLNMGSQLSFQTDQLVINAFGSPEQGTFFDIGNKFFPYLAQIVLGIGMVVMPAATKLQTTGNLEELRHIYLKWSKVAYSIGLMAGVFLLVLGPEFASAWMGPAYATPSGQVTRVLMASFVFFLPVRGVSSPLLMGLGKPAAPALSLLVAGVINLALSLVLVGPYGILGVAIGTAIPNVFYAMAVAHLASHEIGVTAWSYVRYVMIKPTLGAVLPALFLIFLKGGAHMFPAGDARPLALLRLVGAGATMAVIFGVLWLFFVYRDDPYFDVTTKLDRLLLRKPGRKNPATE